MRLANELYALNDAAVEIKRVFKKLVVEQNSE